MELQELLKEQRNLCARAYLAERGYNETANSIIANVIRNAPEPEQVKVEPEVKPEIKVTFADIIDTLAVGKTIEFEDGTQRTIVEKLPHQDIKTAYYYKFDDGYIERDIRIHGKIISNLVEPLVSQPSELLPCPFCGSQAAVGGTSFESDGVYIYCTNDNCHVAMGENYDRDGGDDHWYISEKEVIALWNKRVGREPKSE